MQTAYCRVLLYTHSSISNSVNDIRHSWHHHSQRCPVQKKIVSSEKRNVAEDEKENVDDKGKKPMREEDLPQEQAEADEEAADSPGSRTDMELAWENLEVAKYIYEHEPEGNHAKQLAGIWPKG